MALNVPMQDGQDGKFPLPFQGEVFLLTRDKTQLSFRDAQRHAKHLKGRLFMTNLRIVYLVGASDQEKAGAETFEMPFRGLWDERFNQPIFGCNNLTATIQYYDEQPFSGTLTTRIDFSHGGVNTFLPLFNNVLLATRVQLQQEQQAAVASPPVQIAQQAPEVMTFLPDHNTAFVDPSDPSRIYTTQPAGEEIPRRRDVPTWSVSGGGLRRR